MTPVKYCRFKQKPGPFYVVAKGKGRDVISLGLINFILGVGIN